MKNKTVKILIIAAVVIALIMATVIVARESGMESSKIQEVYIEVITESGEIERIQVDDEEDMEIIKSCFEGEASSDGSLSFTEGGYRIIMAQPDKEWHLYPSGGELGQIRVGDSGDKFYIFDEPAELEQVISKYIDITAYQRAYDWKEVIMEDIKK